MTEKPILFNAEMVCAVLSGDKTQTRRIVKPQPTQSLFEPETLHFDGVTKESKKIRGHIIPKGSHFFCSTSIKEFANKCPYGQISDQLWVRETHMINDVLGNKMPESERANVEILYKATDMDYLNNCEDTEGLRWAPSIHMPRWASRIQLEITNIRVERLQDISVEDAISEGCKGGHGSIADYGYNASPDEHFMSIWSKTYGEHSWHSNPWVWVIEFKKINP